MLNVECESCKAPYQVDERRVPADGLKMRCPKCGHTFLVKNGDTGAPGSVASQKAALPAGKKPPPRIVKATMTGLGGSTADPKSFKGTLPGTGQEGDDVADLPSPFGEVALPAPAAPKAAKPQTMAFSAGTPLSTPEPKPAAPPAAKKPPLIQKTMAGGMAPPVEPAATVQPFGFGELDMGAGAELPMPVDPNRADLPAARPGRAQPTLGSNGAFAPAPFGSLDADLPAVAADLPAIAADLPAVAGIGLPMTKNGGGGFGEIDLPSAVNDLPSVVNDLPMAAPHDHNYPARMDLQAQLPSAAGPGHNLPMAAPLDRHLPAVAAPGIGAGFGEDFGELDLPRAPPVAHAPTLSSGQSDLHIEPLDDGAFGDLDLPGDETPAVLGGSVMEEVSAFDDMGSVMDDMPMQSDPPPVLGGGAFGSIPPVPPTQVGGMGFGEVDLGGGSEEVESGFVPAAAGSVEDEPPVEDPVSVRTAEGKREAPKVEGPKRAIKPMHILGAVGAVILVGAALEFSSLGAFGRLAIGDALHQKEYAKLALDQAEVARKRMSIGSFAEARAANEELANAHARAPRARALAAYAAFAEFSTELRYGPDPERNARAKQWLVEIPPKTEVQIVEAAQAAQAGIADPASARAGLEAVSKRDPNDPFQQDVALARGEIELAARDGKAALAAFERARQFAPSVRAHFGVARAYDLLGDAVKARQAVDQAIQTSATAAGALILRARLAWQNGHDEKQTLGDLATVLEGPAKPSASPTELARAYALRGWVSLQKERATEARASFDEAIKLDARNVQALVGQGEILYADGRYTEALTRYDTARQADSKSLEAILGVAKVYISLERLADAKALLVQARASYPKEMSLALWLGKAEEALGNKTAAEKQYGEAIELADPTQPEAIRVYVAMATLLAQLDRAAEAQKKLEDAKQRLPDSAQLQRSFGDIAAAQGQWERAISHFSASLQRDPNETATRFRLGSALRRMRKIAEARAEFDKVYAADKDYPGLALERGLLYEDSGEVQQALEAFQAALARAPNDADLQLRVGAAYVSIGQADEGLKMLTKVKEQRPNSAEAEHFIGRAYLQKGQLHEVAAMRALKRAVELDPNRAEYHLYVGWAANEASTADLTLAKTEIDRALKLDALLADGYWQRGVVYFKFGALEDAMRDLRRALELRPGRFEVHAALAETYEGKNDETNALAEWQKALAGDDKRAYWRYRYGRLLLDRNQSAAAAEHLSYAASEGERQNPRPPWAIQAQFFAGQALRQIGKKDEAIERLQSFLQLCNPNSPDRRDALQSLESLGAPWQGR